MRLALGEKGRTESVHSGINHLKVSWENKIPIKEKACGTQGADIFWSIKIYREERKEQLITGKEGNDTVGEQNKTISTVTYQVRMGAGVRKNFQRS